MTPAQSITLVAAMGRNRVIGLDGDMPWHFSEDLAHFKRTTMGGVMIMGRKTFDSIGRPLPGRRSIVITRSAEWSHEGVEVVHSLDDALALAGTSAPVFVVGGGEIYSQSLALADRLVLTEIDDAPAGDTYFPEWSRAEWVETARDTRDDLSFVTWERV
ncbi:type 3 dihydrofolate reductase [Conyzicola nivalis]|uniref:Dihydrofolate reductase n=1 Tax=Conyzicola nivalis TaxID=1477021 RepID=A0A916SC93_9MICO|nr:dihydrofolate reductase [Conyzicola nivalis]GGA93236.1 dihydrofolate reductase [Conyzicola nivalis]